MTLNQLELSFAQGLCRVIYRSIGLFHLITAKGWCKVDVGMPHYLCLHLFALFVLCLKTSLTSLCMFLHTISDMICGLDYEISVWKIAKDTKVEKLFPFLYLYKYVHEKDPNNRQLSKIDDSVNELHRQLGILLREFDGIKQVSEHWRTNVASACSAFFKNPSFCPGSEHSLFFQFPLVLIYRGYYTAVQTYKFYLRVVKTISNRCVWCSAYHIVVF